MMAVRFGNVRFDAASEETRERGNSALFRRLFSEGGRVDSELGTAFARGLEHQYAEVLREERPPMNAFAHHTIVSDVPIGAESHTVTMMTHRGRPTWYRGGRRSIPLADVDGRQETFPIRSAMIGVEYDFQEQEAEAFARSNARVAIPVIREKQAAARDGSEQLVNDCLYFGDAEVGLYGILNHPWIPRRVLAAPWGGTAAQAKADTMEALRRLFHSASEVSKQTFAPDTMELSLGLFNFLSFTRESEANGDTMLQVLQRNLPGLRNVYAAHELDGRGPDGADVILCYRRDRRSLSFEASRIGQMLPARNEGLAIMIPHVTTVGGVVSRYPLNNVIGYMKRA